MTTNIRIILQFFFRNCVSKKMHVYLEFKKTKHEYNQLFRRKHAHYIYGFIQKNNCLYENKQENIRRLSASHAAFGRPYSKLYTITFV